MRKTKFIRRLVSGALTAVMLMGLVPTGALATSGGGTHGESTGTISPDLIGRDPQGWTYSYNSFSRYTLIKFDGGGGSNPGANDPSDYKVLGTVDIVDDRYVADISKSYWLGTSYDTGSYTVTQGLNSIHQGGARTLNSVDYYNHNASDLAGSIAMFGGPQNYYAVTQSQFAALGAELFRIYKQAFPDSKALATRPELYDSSKLTSNIIGSYHHAIADGGD